MSAMRGRERLMHKPSQRLFVAAYPEPRVVEAALRELGSMDLPEHRTTPIPRVHLTFQFIGDVRRRDLDAVTESVERSASGIRAFELRPTRLITLPSRGEARLVALEIDRPAGVLELHHRLASRLARSLRREPSDRFHPHMTLCQFRHPEKGVRVDEAVEIDGFRVDEIKLMQTILRPEGVEHRELSVFALD